MDLGPGAEDLFGRYLFLLRKWCRVINLTGVREEREQVVKLILDSLAVVPVVEGFFGGAGRVSGEGGISFLRVMDLGSGAGFPGIPVKVARPGWEMVLVESREKRVSFLKEAVRELKLEGIEVFHGRAEDFGEGRLLWGAGGFQVILCRGVGKLDKVARLCSGLIGGGGILVAMKGPEPEEEIRAAKGRVERFGFRIGGPRFYCLPDHDNKRSLVILQKQPD